MIKSTDMRNGIVLVMFGTSVESALPGLLHIRKRMSARFLQTSVKIAFSSKIIRQIWLNRAADSSYRISHPEIPEDILQIQSPEVAITSLHEEGINSFVVQPVYIAPTKSDAGSDYSVNGLSAFETGMSGSVPIRRIVFGRPALGTYGSTYPYTKDIIPVVRSLSGDIVLARQEKAALYYMGHGNKNCSTSRVYSELVEEMRCQYPDIPIVMSLIEDGPSVDATVAELKGKCVEKILLKAFMVVAGDHARKDMVSESPQCLKAQLEKKGFVVVPIFKGLGEEDDFADIFVQHAMDAARDAGIELR
jgi:sirohydrochlorin cobaltochelatase